MEITQKDVRETAALLHIDINDDEIDDITQSFVTLIEYFSVLNKVVIDESGQTHGDDICRFRSGKVEFCKNTELIEKSEEHEDNYVLIPNIL